jgi:hypothetical protein
MSGQDGLFMDELPADTPLDPDLPRSGYVYTRVSVEALVKSTASFSSTRRRTALTVPSATCSSTIGSASPVPAIRRN